MSTRTQKSRLKFKDWTMKQACFLMCRNSNSLANQALWEIKEYYKATKTMLKYGDLDRKIKNDEHIVETTSAWYNDNYRGLVASCAQQTISNIYDSYRSFFALLKKKSAKDFNKKISEPQFKKKDGVFKVVYASKQFGFNQKTNELKFGISARVKQELWLPNNAFITHKLPGYIEQKNIQEVRLQPNNGGKFYHIEIVYKTPAKEKSEPTGYLGIDPGIDNLFTCVNGQTGESVIFDGKRLKSYNQNFNKQMAKVQSVKDLLWMKFQYTNRQKTMNENRFWFIDNYFNQVAAKVVDYCLKNNINRVFVWKNKEWKQKVNMGKRNNQNFLAIPHAKLIGKLVSKCEEHGIECWVQEESHTSKCSFLDREPIRHQEKYKGRRTKRGLFRTSQETILNADANGAANILVKGLQSLKVSAEIITKVYDWVCNGLVNNPVRLRLEANFQLLNEATA